MSWKRWSDRAQVGDKYFQIFSVFAYNYILPIIFPISRKIVDLNFNEKVGVIGCRLTMSNFKFFAFWFKNYILQIISICVVELTPIFGG